MHQNKIPLGFDIRQTHLIQRFIEKRFADGVDLLAVTYVFRIFQRSPRCCLRDEVAVERLTYPIHRFNNVRFGETVSDSHPRQSVNLRECPCDDNVAPLVDVGQCLRVVGSIDIFVVGFVEDNEDIVRYTRHQFLGFCFRDHCPGRVIRIGDEDDAGLIGDCIRHCR